MNIRARIIRRIKELRERQKNLSWLSDKWNNYENIITELSWIVDTNREEEEF